MAEFLILTPSGWWHLGHSRSWVVGWVFLGVFCLYFASSTVFVPAGSAILNVLVWCRTFRIFDRNFLKLLQRRLPDVTSSPGRSLSSSTNERGRSHLGCHHPVIQWYCCNMVLQESKWKSLPKNTLLPKNMSFCQPSRFPWIPHQQRVLALEKY